LHVFFGLLKKPSEPRKILDNHTIYFSGFYVHHHFIKLRANKIHTAEPVIISDRGDVDIVKFLDIFTYNFYLVFNGAAVYVIFGVSRRFIPKNRLHQNTMPPSLDRTKKAIHAVI
jgi:hypothetical protein